MMSLLTPRALTNAQSSRSCDMSFASCRNIDILLPPRLAEAATGRLPETANNEGAGAFVEADPSHVAFNDEVSALTAPFAVVVVVVVADADAEDDCTVPVSTRRGPVTDLPNSLETDSALP